MNERMNDLPERVDGLDRDGWRRIRNLGGIAFGVGMAGAVLLDIFTGVNLDDGVNSLADVAFLASDVVGLTGFSAGGSAALVHRFGFSDQSS